MPGRGKPRQASAANYQQTLSKTRAELAKARLKNREHTSKMKNLQGENENQNQIIEMLRAENAKLKQNNSQKETPPPPSPANSGVEKSGSENENEINNGRRPNLKIQVDNPNADQGGSSHSEIESENAQNSDVQNSDYIDMVYEDDIENSEKSENDDNYQGDKSDSEEGLCTDQGSGGGTPSDSVMDKNSNQSHTTASGGGGNSLLCDI